MVNKKATVAERTFICKKGGGCNPDPAWGRKVGGKWESDNTPDELSSYDFEYIIDGTKKITPLPQEATEVDVCPGTALPAVETPKIQVRRKR